MQNQNIYTVSRLNQFARQILESEIGRIWLSAEISNFVAASSGHWYFTLKDNRAQVKAAMFRGANSRILQRPKEGDKVLVRANISLYEPRGDYQLIVEHLEQDGEGLLKQEFEKLKLRLHAEGLFDAQHKQPLPDSVNKIGVITSASGAALHDILTVLKRRNPATEVVVYPAQVQGQGATAQLVTALQIANQRNEVDLVILGRGGGSLEDLWCFNEEILARAIFHSRLPVISAVGHEVDVTIADFVADVRAATPSAAAELASTDQQHLFNQLAQLRQTLLNNYNHRAAQARHQVQLLEHKLQQFHPQHQLKQKIQDVDQLTARLYHQMEQKQLSAKHRQQRAKEALLNQSPGDKLQRAKADLTRNHQVLLKAWQNTLQNKKQQLAANAHLLDTVSPLATLARGYSISFKDGDIVTNTSQLEVGDTVTHKLADGEFTSRVESI